MNFACEETGPLLFPCPVEHSSLVVTFVTTSIDLSWYKSETNFDNFVTFVLLLKVCPKAVNDT